ncbi:MAG: bkdB [Ilumatobacteraceae bacterium]|nr:bkdB [Ilumatobacteraceae bacterium]
MTVFGVKLPDVGEGIAEAELIDWLVQVGDHVRAEMPLAEVLTDKATVEISSPVTGIVTYLHGEPGDMVAIGTEFVGIEIEGSIATAPPDSEPVDAPPPTGARLSLAPPPIEPAAPRTEAHPLAAPAVRRRAQELGLDLNDVAASGPGGTIVHADLDRHLTGSSRSATPTGSDDTHVEHVRGLRRRIAERLGEAWTEIPHITYVDEIDATELEVLRAALNRRANAVRLTMLPFVVRALAIACREQPRLNAHYDAEQRALTVFDALHVGIATQTPDGLMVPVVRHAETRRLSQLASEITRLAKVARDGSASLAELSGSTITITSLGALGGLMTTPIINRPEVAIVGVNKMETRPVWRDGAFVPRSMFNLSSSFDHRIVDGWDAATFVQRIKALLETPALLFVDDAV